jgi:hypothetical protein
MDLIESEEGRSRHECVVVKCGEQRDVAFERGERRVLVMAWVNRPGRSIRAPRDQ